MFRFIFRAHRAFAPDEAAKFGVSCSQPLVVTRAAEAQTTKPRLRLSSDKVLVTALKPSDDGKGWIVRLFGASGKPETTRLEWAAPAPRQLWLSDTSEQPGQRLGKMVEVPAWAAVTVRAE